LDGGAHTPTELSKAHSHQTAGYAGVLTSTKEGFLSTQSFVNYEATPRHTHTGGTTGAGSAHSHSNPTTGTGSINHTHSIPATDGPDDTRTVIGGEAGEWDWGTACTLGSCVDSITGVSVADYAHWHLNTGKNSGSSGAAHTHNQGVTGTESAHTHTGGTTGQGTSHMHNLTCWGSTPYVTDAWMEHNIWISDNESPAHAHTINLVAAHPHTGIAEAAHSDHVIATEPAGSVDLNFGIKEIAGGTIMELIVNGETVASNYNGDQTDIVITGYTSTGANTIEIQPAVGQNHKGGISMVGSAFIFLEAKKF
jgi:hypothetical protein